MREIVEQYLKNYLPRREIIHRLPVSMPISQVWPELQKARKEVSEKLPLSAIDGSAFWWVLTDHIIEESEKVIALARRDIIFDRPEYQTAFEEAVLDEAVYSSVIEGAFTTRKEAQAFIREGRTPKNKSEQMVKKNYEALTYVLENIDVPITKETIFQIYSLVTKDTLEEPAASDRYRDEPAFVRSQRGEVVHTAPRAEQVPQMMDALVAFIADSELSPLIKACVAHFYFVYVHPFIDGNGRTARALSYMILLQAGYDFFRYFSISSVIAEERSKYYKAIKDVEDDEYDMTYFIDYSIGMLARAVKQLEDRLVNKVVMEERCNQLKASGANERLLAGAEWLLKSPNSSVTIKAWEQKFGVVTETARQDLFKLEEAGIVKRKLVKRRYEFEVLK